MTSHLEIVTPRLRLTAASQPLLEATLNDRRRLEAVLGAMVPDDWPPADNLDVLHGVVEALRRDRSLVGWGPWLMVARDERRLVGDAGFKGKPAADGVVEIGYGIVPVSRNQGFATEAVVGLITWAFGHGARVVIAETDFNNVPSRRVLEKAGLREVGRDGRMLSWRVERD